MLPYPSYLRVYEPAETFDDVHLDGSGAADGTERVAVTVATEQRIALASTVGSPRFDGAVSSPGAYRLTRQGRDFLCPVELPLRSRLAMGALNETFGDAVAPILVPGGQQFRADEALTAWRRDNPTAVPHIRQSAWGIPRTWFLLVIEDERESYDADGHPGVRYRARIEDARRRLDRAQATLNSAIEDFDLHDELVDLSGWLDAFGSDSWVELDYAGVARLLGAALAKDQSARDVHTALRALRRGDFAAAGAAYRRFEERWRIVNGYERAN